MGKRLSFPNSNLIDINAILKLKAANRRKTKKITASKYKNKTLVLKGILLACKYCMEKTEQYIHTHVSFVK